MKNRTKQPPEFDVWIRLIRAAEDARNSVENTLKKAGFPPLTWYDVLLELERAPHGYLRPIELQRKLLLAQYNLSRLVDRIVGAGYAEKLPLEEDRRGHTLSITANGSALLDQMWPVYRSCVERYFGHALSSDEAEHLNRLLDGLYKKP